MKTSKILFTGWLLAAISLAAVPFVNIADAKEAQKNMPLRHFTQGNKAQPSKTPYGNNLSAGHYVQADDARIYYEVYEPKRKNENTATVFVFHGGGVGTPFEMGQLIDALRKDRKVAVVSTRGHGRSEIGSKPLTYEQKANDMLAVMRAVTDKPVTLVGFSDGAYTSYKIAAMYPDRVERVVTIGAGSLEKGFFSGELKVSDLEKIDKDFVDQQKALMPEAERWQEFCTDYMKFWNRTEVGKDIFASIRCPVLLIAGDEDDHAPLVTMVAAHQMIPNSRLCIVPKAWHTAFLDNFPVTWAAIDTFIHADRNSLQGSRKVEYNNLVLK